MPAAAVCKLQNNIALFLFVLLLFGIIALQKQIRTISAADDRSNNNDNVTFDVIDISPNNYIVENDKAGESLLFLQNLSRGAFVQCRKDTPSHLNATTFWERQCYVNMTESVRFYHLGKGGGGTIFFSLVENGIVVERDHPRPIHGIEQILNGTVSTLLINIRDPVDRFVSAFNWRSLLFCQRDGEKRKKYPSEVDEKDRKRYQPHLHPQEFCFDKSVYPKEATIIQRLYKDDVNKMAESLCEDSINVQEAIQYTKFISHAKLSLAEWLQPLMFDTDTNTTSSIKPQGLSKFMAITLEQHSQHNSSLLQHTHEAVHQLYFDHGVDEKTLDSLLRHKPVRMKGVSEIMTHSSNKTAKGKVLGAIGECCLARFLEGDYRLIQIMSGDTNSSKDVGALDRVHPIISEACNWGSLNRRQLCRADLKSMLHRRAKFLDRNLGTCQDVVSLVDEV